jgi:hypothetical protein
MEITAEHVDAYAVELARLTDPVEAAKAALGVDDDVGAVVSLIQRCNADEGFADRQRILIEKTGAHAFIPTKELLAVEIVNIARTEKQHRDVQLRAYRLAAEILGYLNNEKNVNVSVDQRSVLVVARHANEAEWEEATRIQQAKLINASS